MLRYESGVFIFTLGILVICWNNYGDLGIQLGSFMVGSFSKREGYVSGFLVIPHDNLKEGIKIGYEPLPVDW